MTKITEDEMRSIIIDRCRKRSNAEVARELGISRSYISQIVLGKCAVSDQVVRKLGYRLKENEWVRIRTFEKMPDIA